MGGWVALEEWKLRLTSAKVEVKVEAEAELGKNIVIDKVGNNLHESQDKSIEN